MLALARIIRVLLLLSLGAGAGAWLAFEPAAATPARPPVALAPVPQPVAEAEDPIRTQPALAFIPGQTAPTAFGPGPGQLLDRPRYARSAGVRKLDRIAKRLKAPGATIDNPCIAHDVQGHCERTALSRVFGRLDTLLDDDESKRQRVSVVTFGNSLIASDRVTDVVRHRLQSVFGDGGPGIMYVRPLHFFGRRAWTGDATPGWFHEYLTQHYGGRPEPKYPLGITGGHHVSFERGAATTWDVSKAERFEILYLDHKKSSSFKVEIDGTFYKRLRPSGRRAPTAQTLAIDLPPGAQKVKLTAEGPRVVIYGATLEHPTPGVVWDTVGIVAASANTYLLVDEDVLADHMAVRQPNLVVMQLGGNENRRIDRKVFTYQQVVDDFEKFVDRMRETAPDADCLTVGPIEAVYSHTPKGKEFETRKWLAKVNDAQRRISLEKGCAYFDFYRAMGGEGSFWRFHKAGYVSSDRIHPRSFGLDVLGELFARALFDAYQEEPRRYRPATPALTAQSDADLGGEAG